MNSIEDSNCANGMLEKLSSANMNTPGDLTLAFTVT